MIEDGDYFEDLNLIIHVNIIFMIQKSEFWFYR